ncbi:MAG: hypothetical protein DRJ03_18615 [Chloroflexi bacterium]|nr:MAG: hypothetical protein DRJ03_18615 [Chloroflexota bacterium]
MARLSKKEHRTRQSRRMGYGQRNFWWKVCWWEDSGRGMAYAMNDELIDLLKQAAPPVVDRKRTGLSKYQIVLPSGKSTSLLPDMAFSDYEFFLKVIEAWREVWLTVRPSTPSRAERRAAAAEAQADVVEHDVEEAIASNGNTSELEELRAENSEFRAKLIELEGRIESGGNVLVNGKQ